MGKFPCPPMSAQQTEMEQSRKYAAKLGVEVEFAENLALSRKIQTALYLVRRDGYMLPDRICVDAKHFDSVGTGYAGQFDSFGNGTEGSDVCVVYLNPHFDWNNLSPTWWSTTHPLHNILHELGHAAHYRQDPNYYVRFCKNTVPPSVLAQVSPYAEQSGRTKEFVAEVFVKRVLGYPLSQEVSDAYHHSNGPLAAGEVIPTALRPEVPPIFWSEEDLYY